MSSEIPVKRTQKQLASDFAAYDRVMLEYHCQRLHPKVMQVDGELAVDGALIARGITFVDWPPGNGPHRHNWQDTPLGPVRVWGTIENGVFMLHGYDSRASVIQPRPMPLRFTDLVLGKGRHRKEPDPELIENILQWMHHRLGQGASADDLREESYVLYRWPDRYGSDDELLEGKFALITELVTPNRKRKRSVQSG